VAVVHVEAATVRQRWFNLPTWARSLILGAALGLLVDAEYPLYRHPWRWLAADVYYVVLTGLAELTWQEDRR
jgi:hypothetical protein